MSSNVLFSRSSLGLGELFHVWETYTVCCSDLPRRNILVFALQFQFCVRSSRSARVQPCGRGEDADDEPARVVWEFPVQRHAGRTHADMEERRFLRSVQGLLAQLAAPRTLEHHRILCGWFILVYSGSYSPVYLLKHYCSSGFQFEL